MPGYVTLAPLKHNHFLFHIWDPCCCLAFLCIPSVHHLCAHCACPFLAQDCTQTQSLLPRVLCVLQCCRAHCSSTPPGPSSRMTTASQMRQPSKPLSRLGCCQVRCLSGERSTYINVFRVSAGRQDAIGASRSFVGEYLQLHLCVWGHYWFQCVAQLIALFCMLLQVLYTCPTKAPQANPS